MIFRRHRKKKHTEAEQVEYDEVMTVKPIG